MASRGAGGIAVVCLALLVASVSAADGPGSLFMKAQKAQESGDFAEAVTLFQQIVDSPKLRAADVPAALNGLATSHAQAGQYAEALAAFQRMVDFEQGKAKPDAQLIAQALFNLAYTHDNMGDLPRALETYERAIEKLPTFTQAYIKAAFICSKQGAIDKTIRYLKKVLLPLLSRPPGQL
jgi:tetratricopeptide (TPR) repeat protein